jgi:hypothetical protein
MNYESRPSLRSSDRRYAIPFVRMAFYWPAVDRFVCALYRDHNDLWVSLGKPCGWQWSAPGRIATPVSMFSFRWEWLRSDPEWLPQIPELHDEFAKLRRGYREWNLRAVPILVGVWVFFGLIFAFFQHH